LKRNQVGLPVLQFIDRELFGGGGLDVGELVVVIDGGHVEGFLVVKRVIELQRTSAGPRSRISKKR
jgi:hypothetical protein